MTNWPNIQEYRNFEATFFNNSKNTDVNDFAPECEINPAASKTDCKTNSEESIANITTGLVESKTVRCVIKKDFEEVFKKLDRGDGNYVNCESVRPKIVADVSMTDRAENIDKIRLQRHLEWKKQKEEEYLQKKEVERIAQERKKEEEARLEKIKKQREVERARKLREWQEQKSREKEEKRKEKMVMKVLENELKEVTPVVDKEKLIEEWVKLKNKQKQIEAEKKAELLKKEEESKAIRQSLAELSYRQWKEKIKGRMMTLPKNGYQIFGPKPTPVVKEDWNYDNTCSSPHNQDFNLRSSKSNTTTSFTFSSHMSHLQDFPKNTFYLGEPKNRSSSLKPLKNIKSGSSLLSGCNTTSKNKCEMPLKELQPETINSNSNNIAIQRYYKDDKNILSQNINKSKITSDINWNSLAPNERSYSPKLMYMKSKEGDQNQCLPMPHFKKSMKPLKEFPKVLPDKKKIDLYISPFTENKEKFSVKNPSSQMHKIKGIKSQEETKKEKIENSLPNKHKREVVSKEKFSMQTASVISKNVARVVRNRKNLAEVVSSKDKIFRRPRSYEKPIKKKFKDWDDVKDVSSSRSVVKVTCISQKRKSRRRSKSNTQDSQNEKKRSEGNLKKELKKKNVFLSKSLSFNDSPYCVKKSLSKSLGKGKRTRRKGEKDKESKSDRVENFRKTSTTKH